MPNTPIPASEAATLLGVTPHTVARYARRGLLTPVAKAPGKRGAYLFDRADVERLSATQTAASPARWGSQPS